MATKIITKNGSGAPTAGDLDQGELAVDLTNKRLYTEDAGGNVIEIGTSPSTIDINAGTIDGVTLGTNSAVTEAQIDNININGNAITSTDTNGNIAITPNGTGEVDISKVDINGGTIDGVTIGGASAGAGTFTTLTGTQFSSDATDVELKYSGSTKLATTNTGIDVTGTVTADGLTVDGSVNVNGTVGDIFKIATTAGNADLWLTDTDTSAGQVRVRGDANSLKFITDTKVRHTIANNGDISFYEDTGTTPKLFWDASAESLGIGTTSPEEELHVEGNIVAGATVGYGSAMFGGTGLVSYNQSTAVEDIDALYLRKSGADGSSVGIAFGNAGGGSYYVGARIKHERSGSNSNGDLVFETKGDSSTNTTAEAMRIDSNGNVGIGTSSPSGLLELKSTTSNAYLYITADNASSSRVYLGDEDNATIGRIGYNHGFNFMDFYTNGSEAMRIDSSGNLLVGTTSLPSAGSGGVGFQPTTADRTVILCSTSVSTSANLMAFLNPNGSVGTISTNGSATAYNTSSDYRLKENIVDASSASDVIDAIQVRAFDWKADGSHQRYGMVAQELLEVAPEAVSGDPNSDDMMGVDYSKLVPMLVKEIQELRARVHALENQ